MEKIRYYDELLRFISHSVPNSHEAQDLVQQTFERLLTRYGQVPLENQRALLYEVARNLLIDRYRQQQRCQYESDDALAEVPAARECQPEVIIDQRQRLQLLQGVLLSLPPRRRQAFVLHKIEGRRQTEVAQIMHISVNMVERHIMLAIAACREALRQGNLPREQSTPMRTPVDMVRKP